MAHLYWTTIIYMLIVILVNLWTHAASGRLIVKPRDTYVLAGEVAILNCSTSSTEDVHWYYSRDLRHVYAGRKLHKPYNNISKIEVYLNDGNSSFNLVFPSAKPEDAGMYICRDEQGDGEMSAAEMTVFTSDGNGTCKSNMKPDGVIIPNDCNIDSDEVQLSCSVTFYGNNPPQLEWKKVPENSSSNANATQCQSINNSIICNISITSDRQMNCSSYVCQTTGSSQLNIRFCTIEVKNLIYAFSGKFTTKSSVGNEVQCNLDTSQSCHYKWKHSDSVVSTNRTITPDTTGLYQCEAECYIRGKRCIVFEFAYISNDDSTSCPTGCVAGICVGILLLVITISTVIYCLLLKKKKDKSQENGTQQERTLLIQPYENMEPTLVQTIRTKASEEGKKLNRGLTILDKELFVVSDSCSDVEVYDSMNFSLSRRWNLSELTYPLDIGSCNGNKCLYIFNNRGNDQSNEIFRVDPNGQLIKTWSTTEDYNGRLSVTDESNIIISVFHENKLNEYSPEGQLIREINLSSDANIRYQFHAIKLANGHFLVSHVGDLHRVCIVDVDGKLLKPFGAERGSTIGQMDDPVYLSIDENGFVMVADRLNGRVLLLNSDLEFKREILSKDKHGLRYPERILLDESNGRLFVADNELNNPLILIFEFK